MLAVITTTALIHELIAIPLSRAIHMTTRDKQNATTLINKLLRATSSGVLPHSCASAEEIGDFMTMPFGIAVRESAQEQAFALADAA